MAQEKKTNVTTTGIVFSSPADSPLPAGTGVPIVVTGSNATGTATAHGTVAGIVIHVPA